MARFLDVAKFLPTAGGTTDWTVSSAVTGYQTPVSAGAIDGQIYRYRAESNDLSQWEIGYGTASSTGTVFARTTVLFNSSGTTSKISFSAVPTVGIVPLGEDFREKLDANRTYYVLTTGSDSNNGLANTSGGAFLTIQKAIDTVAALDISTFNVTIQVGSGTYTGNVVVTGPWVGSGTVTLLGDATTPSNVLLNATGTAVSVKTGGRLNISGFKVQATSVGLSATTGSLIQTTGLMDLGACPTFGAFSSSYASINFGANFTVSGGALCALAAQAGGTINIALMTATISGTPAFSVSFVIASQMGLVIANGFSFSGSGATGPRYSAATGGGIYTAGGGASFFPGNSTGTATAPGWYN